MVSEELGTRAPHEIGAEDAIDRLVDGVRSLIDGTEFGVRIFLAGPGGRLRVARTAGTPLNVGSGQATTRRRTAEDLIVRTLQRGPLGVSIFPIDRRGRAIGVAEITAPVATLERRRDELESSIGRMSEIFRRAIERDVRARELDLSLAWTAHELRGPLQAVRAWLEHAGSDTTQVNLPLRRATDELARISGGVESLLSWAAGREHLDEDDVDLVELVSDAVDSCVAETGQDRVVMEGSEGLIVRGDATHLRSAVENLVRNALRYSAPDTKVRVIVEPRDGWFAVEVENESPGIEAADLDAIFGPMARGSNGVGTGLGLFVVRKVAERHGGTIRCDQPVAGKTSFELRLPPTAALGAAPSRSRG